MDKILEMLGITKLNEESQEKLKIELEAIIESKSAEKADDKIKDEKEKLAEEMEVKYENYKDDIISKFSNFLDDILEEELVLPEKVIEFARIGEEYHSLIESFKIKLAIDNDVLDEEVTKILKESKDEILKLQGEKDLLTSTKLDLELKNTKIENENYLFNKCDGLVPDQKQKVMSVLEGATKEEIDKKFDIIVKLNEKKDDLETKSCPQCDEDVPEDDDECPNCGYNFKTKEKGTLLDKDKDKKSKTEVKDKKTNENDPKAAWLKMINEGRI